MFHLTLKVVFRILLSAVNGNRVGRSVEVGLCLFPQEKFLVAFSAPKPIKSQLGVHQKPLNCTELYCNTGSLFLRTCDPGVLYHTGKMKLR